MALIDVERALKIAPRGLVVQNIKIGLKLVGIVSEREMITYVPSFTPSVLGTCFPLLPVTA